MGKFKVYEDILKLRYTHLYGNAGFDSWLKRENRKIRALIITVVLLIIAMIVNDFSTAKNEYKNLNINKNGEIVSAIRPGEGENSYSFTSKALITTSECLIEKEYYITIEPAGESVPANDPEVLPDLDEKDTAETELKRLISHLNEDTTITEVKLPGKLDNGCEVVWKKAGNTDYVMYCMGLFIILWLIYHNRFYGIKKEEKRARESIIKELPEFINKLVLLVNAGVILNSAFLKIVDDCDEIKCRNSYFYKRICEIGHVVRETNASFYNELYNFAKYSRVKELMRITNIIMDNISKGDDLSDKLKRENELLWFARKQQAEEKGKLAETKLTLPLMILLTVLIIITISPALMEI